MSNKINMKTVDGLVNILDGKAAVDLSNSPYITNRILEIQQNLQISVSGDTITISGKATRLNGDLVDINVSRTLTGTVGKTYVLISSQPYSSMDTWTYSENNGIASYQQSSQPTVTATYAFWFDTTNNKLMFTYNTGSSWIEVVLPFGVAHYTSNGWVIDQIFNGFGYIGSTVFALPGVKVQFSTGQNTNGTCITEIKTLDTVLTNTLSGTSPAYVALRLWNNNVTLQHVYTYNVFFQQQMPSSTTNYVSWFDGIKWRVYYNGSWVENYWSLLVLAQDNFSSGKITSLLQCQVDSVANSNMSNISSAGRSFISGMSCPSNRAGILVSNSFASSTKFTAPENGYFCLRMGLPSSGSALVFLSNLSHTSVENGCLFAGGYYSGTGGTQNIIIQVQKGQQISAQYNGNASFTFDSFCGLWFIPCEGG